MTELILSDITRMGPGHCIIGLERVGSAYRSVRPLPRFGNAWPKAFAHKRGERLQFSLSLGSLVQRPHVEDRPSTGAMTTVGAESEEVLVACLRQAELAETVKDLFGCNVHESPRGGAAVWIQPAEAIRSICGASFENVRFRIVGDRLRAALALPSGEALRSLPVVDREWNEFAEEVLRQTQGANQLQRVERFLNRTMQEKLLHSPVLFARIGLTRPDADGHCWLMLDSLFPEPQEEWLSDLQ